jgi:hypothetical protein
LIEPVWFDSEAFELFMKNSNSSDSRDFFTNEFTHFPTQVLWTCRPSVTMEFEMRDASGTKLDGNSGAFSSPGLLVDGFAVNPLLQDPAQ